MNDLATDYRRALRDFLADGRFATDGAVMTDLDGTAVLEREGRIWIPPEVERGLQHIRDLGRPVIVNTLRFPLSVIRVFGDEWHRATGTSLPLVSMRGSQIGRVVRSESGEMAFEEWHAEVLAASEVDELVTGVRAIVDSGVDDLLVFRYPRDWRQGEHIWTPDPARAAGLQVKYASATTVTSSPVDALRDTLLSEPHCMIFLLIDLPQDRLMAYQHTQRSNFITHRGIAKRDGARRIAALLGVDLSASIGAGDAPPDDFLAEVGFAVIVGNQAVDYAGRSHTVRVAGIPALGDLLATVGASLE